MVQDARREQEVDTAVLRVKALGVHDLEPDVLQTLLDGTNAHPLHRHGGDVDAETLVATGESSKAIEPVPQPISRTGFPTAWWRTRSRNLPSVSEKTE